MSGNLADRVHTAGNSDVERARVDALHGRNAQTYSQLCDDLGIVNPEDAELYDEGHAEMIYRESKCSDEKQEMVRRAKEALDRARGISSDTGMVSWLKLVGYRGVYVRGKRGSVPFEQAPSENIYRMYKSEIKRQERIRDEGRS